MKRNLTNRMFIFGCLMLLAVQMYAQTIPSNLTGEELRDWLKENYYDSEHTTLGYSTARKYMYNYIDNHDNTITCVYSGYEKSWTYGGTGTNPSPINCEHTVPQSFFDKSEPMRSDIHHLFPTYSNWNSIRSNYPFDEIDDDETTKWIYLDDSQSSIPTSNIDAYSEYKQGVFEPREDHKGNIARAIFYFYTMYPTEAGDISDVADIDVLYTWHLEDPVDEDEIERNDLIEEYQGNRNPYIDYPDIVDEAWDINDSSDDETTYCESKGSSSSGEWISNVEIGSFSNSSVAAGYTDFTSKTVEMSSGETSTITLTPGFSGKTYSEYWKIWIDFNNDGDFEDSNEEVFDAGTTSTAEVNGSITVPSDVEGSFRMRVTMKYKTEPTSCETFSYGEVEDYTVTIGNSLKSSTDIMVNSIQYNEERKIKIYPNPVEDVLNIQVLGNEIQNVNLKMYNAQSQLIYQDILNNISGNVTKTIYIEGFNPGIYFIELKYDDKVQINKIVVK